MWRPPGALAARDWSCWSCGSATSGVRVDPNFGRGRGEASEARRRGRGVLAARPGGRRRPEGPQAPPRLCVLCALLGEGGRAPGGRPPPPSATAGVLAVKPGRNRGEGAPGPSGSGRGARAERSGAGPSAGGRCQPAPAVPSRPAGGRSTSGDLPSGSGRHRAAAVLGGNSERGAWGGGRRPPSGGGVGSVPAALAVGRGGVGSVPAAADERFGRSANDASRPAAGNSRDREEIRREEVLE
jgi:hypothetical protein